MNRKNVAKVRVFILVIILLLSVMAGCGMNDTQSTETSTKTSPMQSLPYDGKYPQHEPYGTGIGAMPGRVVWSHNPDSVGWDGSGYTKGEKIAIKVNYLPTCVTEAAYVSNLANLKGHSYGITLQAFLCHKIR